MTGANSLRKVINQKQKWLDENRKGRNELMMLIKPGNDVDYKTIIDVLDETTINLVKKYAVLKQSQQEVEWMKKKVD